MSPEMEMLFDKSMPFTEAIAVFRVLTNATRKKILLYLSKHERVDVATLQKELKIEQSLCSIHLHSLRKIGVVTSKREGRAVFYTLIPSQISIIGSAASNLLKLAYRDA